MNSLKIKESIFIKNFYDPTQVDTISNGFP